LHNEKLFAPLLFLWDFKGKMFGLQKM